MRHPSPRPRQWYLCLGILLVLVLTTIPLIHATYVQSGDGVTVGDGVRTLSRAELSASPPIRISGLREQTIRVSYQQADGTELINCPITFRYTTNGADPTGAGSATQSMTCAGDLAPNQPATSHNYEVKPPASTWNTAPVNALVRFRIEWQTTPASCNPCIDNNNGLFYQYRIDRSQGQLLNKVVNNVPIPVPGASIQDAVTTDDTPSVSFRISDNNLEGPVDFNSIGIDFAGVNRTTSFNCNQVDGATMDCSLDYSKLPAGFKLQANTTTVITVTGRDAARNDFDATKSSLRIRVDNRPPDIRSITAVPNQGVFTTTPPTVGKGVNVTVRANLVEANNNTNCLNCVFAQLFNTSASLNLPPYPFVPMTYNATIGKWEAKNVTIPLTWPDQAFGVGARVTGFDMAGNVGLNVTTTDQFQLDPIEPAVEVTALPAFIKDQDQAIKVKATDVGSGVDPNTVIMRYTNQTAAGTGFKFTTPPAGHTKVAGTTNTFEVKMTRQGNTDNYTATLPAAKNNTVITYSVGAKDKAGGAFTSTTFTTTVDLNPPTIQELGAQSIRGPSPYGFRFQVQDAGAGVNTTDVKLFTSTGGAFAPTDLARVGTTNEYAASVNLTVPNEGTIRYYVEAKDLLGNMGTLNTSAAPLEAQVDLEAPEFGFTSVPTNSTGPTFTIRWNATDNLAGVATYTVHARLMQGTTVLGDWIPVAENVTTTQLEVCGRGGFTYQFRGFATDRAGNVGDVPSAPQNSTALGGEGCAEEVVVDVLAPSGGQTLDAAASSNFTVRWNAASTRTLTPTSQLRVTVFFSPDNGAHYFAQATNVVNTGSFSLDLTKLPSCDVCLIQVRAATFTNVTKEATSGAFRIRGGDPAADLDGNGLSDSWELEYGTALGEFDADDDEDDDGLTNLQEATAGTNPKSRDTDGDGVSDRLEIRLGTNPLSAASVPSPEDAREEQFTPLFWSVPAAFVAVAIVFFVGLARRW